MPAQRRAAQNRTTVAAKGVNGSNKTVITIRKVYPNKSTTSSPKLAKPKLLTPFKPLGRLRRPEKPEKPEKPSAITESEYIKEQTPLGAHLTISTADSSSDCASTVTNLTDAAESFGIEMPVSPSSTLHDCPPLKSPSFSGKSIDSAGSLDTLLAEDTLDQWGIPEVARQSIHDEEGYFSKEYEELEEQEPEELPFHLYGIGSDPELISYYDSDLFIERSMKVDQIRYMSLIVLAYKLKQKRQMQASKTAELKRQLQVQRDIQLQNRYVSFFGSWM